MVMSTEWIITDGQRNYISEFCHKEKKTVDLVKLRQMVQQAET